MRSTSIALRKLSRFVNNLLLPTEADVFHVPRCPVASFVRPLSSSYTTDNGDQPSQSDRDAAILEKFKIRKLKGSKRTQDASSSSGTAVKDSCNGLRLEGEPTKVVSGFEELGLSLELIEALDHLGILVPPEIQCVGIPAILEGKSVLLASPSGSARTLAYLLPLVQLLKESEKNCSSKSKYPRALVLCATEEMADEVFSLAKYISHFECLKSAGDKSKIEEDASDVSIGLLISTPSEVLELIEEGKVVPDEIKYLVLDEVDTMLGLASGLDIQRILSSLKRSSSGTGDHKVQTVLVTSAIKKMLHEQLPTFLESIEHDNAGEIAAVLLEMEEAEVFHLIESPEALKQKVADAVKSLHLFTQGS